MSSETFKLTFVGGTGSVTGANFLFEGAGLKILIDCGLEQGEKEAEDSNWEPFPYDPKTIDYLFITHGHVDHIGRIPKLVYDGFQGKIISTQATHDIALPMLNDTMGILSHDKLHHADTIYTAETVNKSLSLWRGIPYYEVVQLAPGFSMRCLDAGHILGSAMLEFTYNGEKIVFTGDLGNSPSTLLRDTDHLENVSYLIMESVYGDRNHEGREMRREKLITIINSNHARQGTLVVPTFSLERSQEMLLEINEILNQKLIAVQPIFLDSPLAIHLLPAFRAHPECFNDTVQKLIKSGDDVFNFPGLTITETTESSKHILAVPDPKIVIAGSGMSNGGRILHHEQNYLSSDRNTLLLTGYQSVGTLGRHIIDGEKEIRIYGQTIPIKANVMKILGYSGHKDSDHLVEFVSFTKSSLKQVFCVMGEPKSAMFLAQRLNHELGVNAGAPEGGTSVTITLGK